MILTKNGYGDMVVLSYEAYERLQYELGICAKLREAEVEAEMTRERYLHEDVMADLRQKLKAMTTDEIEPKLDEADKAAAQSDMRLTEAEVFDAVRSIKAMT